MTPQDHIGEAGNCLETSEYLTGRGMRLLSSELLWLAAKYAVNAVALQRELPHGNYRQKEMALATIAAGHPYETKLVRAFDLARHQIHPNSDKDFLSADVLESHCREVREFVAVVLGMVETGEG